MQYVLCDDWSVVPSTVEVELSGKQLLPGDALLLAGVLKGNKRVKSVNVGNNSSDQLAQASLLRVSR